MMEEKRKWEKPQLIVLERGRPEENVLGGCKIDSIAGPFQTPTCGISGSCNINVGS